MFVVKKTVYDDGTGKATTEKGEGRKVLLVSGAPISDERARALGLLEAKTEQPAGEVHPEETVVVNEAPEKSAPVANATPTPQSAPVAIESTPAEVPAKVGAGANNSNKKAVTS